MKLYNNLSIEEKENLNSRKELYRDSIRMIRLSFLYNHKSIENLDKEFVCSKTCDYYGSICKGMSECPYNIEFLLFLMIGQKIRNEILKKLNL